MALFRAAAWLIVLLGIPIALDMVGPWQGWMARASEHLEAYLTGQERPTREPREGYDSLFATPDRPEQTDQTDQTDQSDQTDQTDQSDSPETEREDGGGKLSRNPEAQTPFEEEFQAKYKELLDLLPKPKPGTSYSIRTRDGKTLEGRLIEVRPGRLVLETEYGKLGVPIDSLHPKEVKRFFPRRAAINRALEILVFREQRKNAKPKEPAGDDTSKIASKAPKSEKTSPSNRPSSGSGGSPVKFDPTPEESDQSLLPLVEAFADWLEVQHRRIGGKVADKVFAHQQNGTAILYLILNPQFMEQDYEVRFQFAESLWQFWGFRAHQFGAVSAPGNAYVVLLDSNRKQIGGSRPDNGSKVWMKGGGGTVTVKR